MTEHHQETLSIEEAAAVLKVGVPTVEALITRGELVTRKEGDKIRVRYEELLAFMRESHRASTEDGEAPAGDLGAELI